MKTHYWIVKLKLATVWKILRQSKPDKNNDHVERLTYIFVTKPAAWALKRLLKRKRPNILIEKIEPRDSIGGPILNLYNVKDKDNRLLIMRIYRHVLDIRRQIVTPLMKQSKNSPFMKNQRTSNFITAFLGLKIAENINNAVFLAHYGKWKYYHTADNDEERAKNVMILPRSPWSITLGQNLEQLMDRVSIIPDRSETLRQFFTIIKALVRSIVGTVGRKKPTLPEPRLDGSKIMTYYAMGVEKTKRNDIGFLFGSGIPLSRLVLYCKYESLLPSQTEKEWLKQNQIVCFGNEAVPGKDKDIPAWVPTAVYRREMNYFYRVFMKTLSRFLFSGPKGSLNILETLWKMGKLRAYWKDFFISNRVSIVVNSIPAIENFIPNLAVAELGGIAVNIERSILFDYCTVIHNSPAHVHFITGPYSLTQVPEPSFSLNTLEVGMVNVENSDPDPEINALRENSRIIIALMDEIPNHVFYGDSIREFYQSFIDLLKENQRFAILIKSKKPQVLDGMPDIKKEVEELRSKGQCVIADWKMTAPTAAAQSDLVACVPSTAVFESVLSGTPTVLYNPMRTGSTIFYTQDGLNRRVFEDKESMIGAFRLYAEGKNPSLGDCSDLIPKIDPFSDKNGPKRIGDYLFNCLDGYDNALNTDQVIKKANDLYVRKWGEEKIHRESEYEK